MEFDIGVRKELRMEGEVMGLSVNASYNIGMNTGAYPGAGGAGVMDDETQSKLYKMQEKLEEMKSTAKGMEEYAKEAPRLRRTRRKRRAYLYYIAGRSPAI